MWKPDCIAVALSTQSFTTLAGAPYLEIARLSTRRPSTAAAVVGRPDALRREARRLRDHFRAARKVVLEEVGRRGGWMRGLIADLRRRRGGGGR